MSIYNKVLSGAHVNMKNIIITMTEIKYKIENEDKIIVVDHLFIKKRKFKKYRNKLVKIYVYNNMSYIDIIN